MASWPNDVGFDNNYEQRTPAQLTVKGEIPKYAAGVMYRTGPLGYKIDTDKKKQWAAGHWFDGLASIHRFQIDAPEEGPVNVTYRSRRIVDELMETVKKTGKLDGVTFGAKRDPCKSFFKKMVSTFAAPESPPNIGVTVSVNMPGLTPVKDSQSRANGHSNGVQTLYTKSDIDQMCKINPETLEPEGVAKQTVLHPDLKGPMSASHAKSDPVTGDIFNFNLELGPTCYYRVFQTSASTGKTDILATFTGTPTYIHSLFITESYVILCVWSSHLTKNGISVLYHKNVIDAIAPFDKSKKAKWYVVDRLHGKGLVATYESEAFFAFHTINAWEEPNAADPTKKDILTELVMYDNLDLLHRFYYDNLLSSGKGHKAYTGQKRLDTIGYFARFRLNKADSGESATTLRPAEVVYKADRFISGELPTINPRFFTKPHQFTYGLCDRLKSTIMDGIVKFDSQTQTAIFWETDGHTPGEAIFIANPDGEKEDDGVLLSVVLDGHKEQSYLLVLDARDLHEVGRAEVPGPIALGLHGAHVPNGRKYGGDL